LDLDAIWAETKLSDGSWKQTEEEKTLDQQEKRNGKKKEITL